MRLIMLNCGADSVVGPTHEDITRTAFEAVPTGEEWRIGMINELIEIRDGVIDITGLATNELEEMLVFLCTT